MNKKIIYFLIAVCVIFFQQMCLAENVEPYKIYVAETNRGVSDGTEAAPYTDIEHAKKHVRELISSGAAPHGIEVIFRGGTYHIDKTINFTKEESGTADAPITYKAYPGENVTFTAAQSIDSSKFALVADEKTLSRLPEDARGYVYSLSLPAQGIYDYGAIRKIANNTDWYASSAFLVVNDDIAELSSWPNNGSFTTIKEMFPYSGWGYDFSIEEDRLSRWTEAEEPYVHGQFIYDWADDMAGIKSIDPKNKRIVTSNGFEFGCKEGGEFHVINLLEEIDMPGEYYINRNNGMLYYYPKEGTDITKSKVELVTYAGDLIQLDNVSYMNFEGLTMSGNCFRGFQLVNNCSNNSFRNMEFVNIGGWAINVENSVGTIIDHCYIHRMGKGGIRVREIGKTTPSLEASNDIISNNHIEDYTRINKKLCSAIRYYNTGGKISHNRINDSGSEAINFGGKLNVIEYNDIYAVAKETQDGGYIYSGGTCGWFGNVVRYNFIHEGPSKGYWGRQGVYFDDMLTGNEIYGNYMVNINSGVSLHAAKYNTVVNNLFFNIQGQNGISSGATHLGSSSEDCIKNSARFKEKWESGELLNDPSCAMSYYTSYASSILNIYKSPIADEVYEKWPFLHPDVMFGKGRFLGAQGNVLKGNVLISKKNLYTSPLYNRGTYPYYKDFGIDPVSIDCVMENNHEIMEDPANYVEDFENGNYNIKDEKIFDMFDKELIPDFKLPRIEEIGIEDETDTLEMEDFNILYPKNGQTDMDANDVVLCWEKTPTVTKYHLVVAKDKDFKNVILDTTTFMNYYRFRNLEFNETTYFWKVEGMSVHWKYKERSRMNKNGVHTFRTLMNENVNKTLLEERFNIISKQYEISVEGAEPGQSIAGSKEYLKPYIEEADKILKKSSATKKDVNNTLVTLNRAFEFFDNNKNPVQLDIADLFSEKSNWSTNTDNNYVSFSNGSGGYKGESIKGYHIFAFTLETSDISEGWISFGIKANTVSQTPWDNNEYMFLVKKEAIELQKYNGGLGFFHTKPNEYVKDGKKCKVLFSAIPEDGGVRIVLNIDGQEVYNILDTEKTMVNGGMFHVYVYGNPSAKIYGYND